MGRGEGSVARGRRWCREHKRGAGSLAPAPGRVLRGRPTRSAERSAAPWQAVSQDVRVDGTFRLIVTVIELSDLPHLL